MLLNELHETTSIIRIHVLDYIILVLQINIRIDFIKMYTLSDKLPTAM
jgi:hypothetical protein